MANSKVQLADGTVLMDLTGDTVSPETLVQGATAHDAAGNPITGTANYIPTSEKGVANGVATLGSDGKVPQSQLPSGGDSYTKAETLTAATAALYGLGSSAVPNDILAWLGNYNTYCWRRIQEIQTVQTENITSNIQIVDRQGSISYSSEIDTNLNLVNPTTIYLDATSAGAAMDSASALADLAPCYITGVIAGGNAVYLLPSGSTGSGSSSSTVTGISKSVYMSGSASTTIRAKKVISVTKERSGEWEPAFSTNRNAYPDKGIVGNYYYEFIGIPVSKFLETNAKIATGNYVGTGTSGSSNPNSITFPFAPKLVIISYGWSISSQGSSTNRTSLPWQCGALIDVDALSNAIAVSYENRGQFAISTALSTVTSARGSISTDGKTISWYADDGATPVKQLNANGYSYFWIAIG